MTRLYTPRDAVKVLAACARLLADPDMSPQRRARLEAKASHATAYLDKRNACRHCGRPLELAGSLDRKAGSRCAAKASAA